MQTNFSKKKIEIINDKYFTIFKVDNFFDNDFYEELKNNYPVQPILKKTNNKPHPKSGTIDHHKVQNKYGIDYRPSIGPKEKYNFEKILKKNQVLNEVDKLLNSSDFFDFFIKKLHFKVINNQKNILKKIKYLRPPKKSINLHNNSFFNNFNSMISLDYSYTSMKNNGFLRPHSDSPRKYISLLMYFPDDNVDDIKYGTSFWKFNRGNYNNIPILDDSNYLKFKNEAELIVRNEFKKNCFYGFIRSDFSWHSVEPVNVNDSYIRKTLTVNFIYDN